MGILDKFFGLFQKGPANSKFAKTYDGWLPIYSQFGTNIYASDVVQQALKCIVDELKKLHPCHVRYIENEPTRLKSSAVQAILDDPNEYMTTSEFLEKMYYLLLLNLNAFVIPTYEIWTDQKTGEQRKYYTAFYPIKPIQVDFIQDLSGKLFVKFWFMNGETTTLPYSDVIHLKIKYSINEFMGGNEMGEPDNQAILSTLQLNDEMLKGIAKAMNASYAINGIVQYNTLLDANGEMENALREFERKLRNNVDGFLPMDLKANVIPFERKGQIVDEATLKFVDEKILRNWGISLPILTGDYTKEQYEAFYQKALEPLIIESGQAFTKKIFSRNQKAFGNRIEFYPEELVFMSIDQKLKMIELCSPTGTFFENEKRTILGLMPSEELNGVRLMSLNWIDAKNADLYQVGKNENMDVVDELKEEV